MYTKREGSNFFAKIYINGILENVEVEDWSESGQTIDLADGKTGSVRKDCDGRVVFIED